MCDGFQYSNNCAYCQSLIKCLGAEMPLFIILLQESNSKHTPNRGLNKKLMEVYNGKEVFKEEM